MIPYPTYQNTHMQLVPAQIGHTGHYPQELNHCRLFLPYDACCLPAIRQMREDGIIDNQLFRPDLIPHLADCTTRNPGEYIRFDDIFANGQLIFTCSQGEWDTEYDPQGAGSGQHIDLPREDTTLGVFIMLSLEGYPAQSMLPLLPESQTKPINAIAYCTPGCPAVVPLPLQLLQEACRIYAVPALCREQLLGQFPFYDLIGGDSPIIIIPGAKPYRLFQIHHHFLATDGTIVSAQAPDGMTFDQYSGDFLSTYYNNDGYPLYWGEILDCNKEYTNTCRWDFHFGPYTH